MSDDPKANHERQAAGSIGQRIRLVRASMRQPDFAKSVAISANTLSRNELGKTTPDSQVLAEICRRYNVDGDWLLTGRGKMRFGAVTHGAAAPGEVAEDNPEPEDLMQRIILHLERYLAAGGIAVPPAKKSDLLLAIHQACQEQGMGALDEIDIAKFDTIIRLAAD